MLEKLFDAGGYVFKFMNHLDRGQWVVVLFVVLVLGFFCMKSMGSKRAI